MLSYFIIQNGDGVLFVKFWLGALLRWVIFYFYTFFCDQKKQKSRGFRFPRTPKRPRRGAGGWRDAPYAVFRLLLRYFSASNPVAHTSQPLRWVR